MGDPTGQSDHLSESDLPQALADDLAGLFPPPGSVPGEVDRAILSDARRHLVGRGRSRLIFRLAPLTAAAAAIALVFWAVSQRTPTPSDQQPVAQRAAVQTRLTEDIDANGRVDILDAFVLAKRVEGRGSLESRWDFTGDRIVDGRDVDHVALAAVSIDKGILQ